MGKDSVNILLPDCVATVKAIEESGALGLQDLGVVLNHVQNTRDRILGDGESILAEKSLDPLLLAAVEHLPEDFLVAGRNKAVYLLVHRVFIGDQNQCAWTALGPSLRPLGEEFDIALSLQKLRVPVHNKKCGRKKGHVLKLGHHILNPGLAGVIPVVIHRAILFYGGGPYVANGLFLFSGLGSREQVQLYLVQVGFP